MRANIRKVIDAFLAGKPAKGDGKGTCSTDGTIVYSYAMPIAKRLRGGTVVIVPREDAPSNTTRSQITALELAYCPEITHCRHDECYRDASMRAACRKASKLDARIVRKFAADGSPVPPGVPGNVVR